MAAAVEDGLCLRLSGGHAAQEAPSLEGLVVVDVVEGTAVASLPRMSAILSNRPPSLATCQEDYARRQWPLKSSLSKQSDSHRGRRMLVCLSRLVYSVHTFAAHAGKRFYRRATQVSGPLQSNLQGGVQ